MKVVITGGAGFLGSRLCEEVLKRGELTGRSGRPEAVDEVVVFDVQPAAEVSDDRIKLITGDVSDPIQALALIDAATDTVFHLGAMVSGGAEADFDVGYQSNLDGTRCVLEACRRLAHNPRVIFTSSVAAYGGELPEIVDDSTLTRPETSYGVQKVIGELLINDYTRKGYLDGRSARLPAIVVRPGRPNTAASSWCSGIIREPLSGVDTVCPVTPETRLPCLSPRRVMEAFITLHEAPPEAFGAHRTVLLPGLTVTAAQMVESAERHQDGRAFGAVKWKQDPFIQNMVDGWPKGTDAAQARSLGIAADGGIDEIVGGFVTDYLDLQIALATSG
jgi:nucleoside-diphosphate-sugar epimerase